MIKRKTSSRNVLIKQQNFRDKEKNINLLLNAKELVTLRYYFSYTEAHQAPPSLGFSRQEHWSGLHFLLQCMKVKSENEVVQSCRTHSDPVVCSLPGASIHGIFQARVLEWGASAFSHIS